MTGEQFLNKIYKDLNLSNEVRKTANGTKNKDEAVARYMDRLNIVHGKAVENDRYEDMLKKLYYKKYIIKEENIPKNMDKRLIIKQQRDSLEKWLDFLLSEDNVYPMWAKYWVFQGMLKIGTYDEAQAVYQKRSKKTVAPFIEINHEVGYKCMSLVTDYIGNKKISDEELNKLIRSGNFARLYTLFLKQSNNKKMLLSDYNDGEWIKYNKETKEEVLNKEKQGIIPEYLKLYNSLQGYNTKWCTAGGEEVAKGQLSRGDFYVYYTKDENNEYKIPRIAIRMEDKRINEIRVVLDGQNIEDGLEIVIENKLKTFENFSEKEILKNLEIVNNMKLLKLLNKKNINGLEFYLD